MSAKPKGRMATTDKLAASIQHGVTSVAGKPAGASGSKYRDEAEKPLDRPFERQPTRDTHLIIDDADDLFGKRSADKP